MINTTITATTTGATNDGIVVTASGIDRELKKT